MIADGHYDAFIGAPLTSGMCAGLGFINSAPAIQAGLAYAQHPTKSGGDPGQQTIAMVKGLEEQIPTEEYGTVLLCDNSKACVEAVEAGKADVAAGTWAGLEYYIYETGSTLVTSLLPGQNMDADIAVSRDCDTQLLAAMNNYIYSISEDELAGYLSTGNLHPDSSSVLLFARRYPVQAMMAVTAVTALVAAIVVCLLLRASRQRAKMQAVHNRQLSQALQIARDANEAKTTFLSNMSHDIRTPLNVVLGMTQVAQKYKNDGAKLDNALNAEIATELLEMVGLRVEWAENGKVGIQRYEASAPDEYFAVFMDMQMPVMDGVTATRLIRQSSRPDHDIPIFAMTANTFASDRRRCREAGMTGYIPKPVSVKNIEEALTVIET